MCSSAVSMAAMSLNYWSHPQKECESPRLAIPSPEAGGRPRPDCCNAAFMLDHPKEGPPTPTRPTVASNCRMPAHCSFFPKATRITSSSKGSVLGGPTGVIRARNRPTWRGTIERH